MEHILTHSPFLETSILRDFHVHHQLWLSSSFTDQPGEQAFNFALTNDIELLVQHLTHIPNHLGDRPIIFDLFLTVMTLKEKPPNLAQPAGISPLVLLVKAGEQRGWKPMVGGSSLLRGKDEMCIFH